MAYADTLSESNEELVQLLQLIDYTKKYFFISLSERTVLAVRAALKQRNVEISYEDFSPLYTLPKEKALESDIQ